MAKNPTRGMYGRNNKAYATSFGKRANVMAVRQIHKGAKGTLYNAGLSAITAGASVAAAMSGAPALSVAMGAMTLSNLHDTALSLRQVTRGRRAKAKATAIDDLIQRGRRARAARDAANVTGASGSQSMAGGAGADVLAAPKTRYADRQAVQGSMDKWGGRGRQLTGAVTAIAGGLFGPGIGVPLVGAGIILASKGVTQTSKGQRRIVRANAMRDLANRVAGRDLRSRVFGKGGSAYLNAAAAAKAQRAPGPGMPGGAGGRPAAQLVRADGMTAGYSRIDPRTGKTVQVKGYQTPGR